MESIEYLPPCIEEWVKRELGEDYRIIHEDAESLRKMYADFESIGKLVTFSKKYDRTRGEELERAEWEFRRRVSWKIHQMKNFKRIGESLWPKRTTTTKEQHMADAVTEIGEVTGPEFKNVHPEDRVWDLVFGWGRVNTVWRDKDGNTEKFTVRYDVQEYGVGSAYYSVEGVAFHAAFMRTVKNQRTLYWGPVKIIAPPKPPKVCLEDIRNNPPEDPRVVFARRAAESHNAALSEIDALLDELEKAGGDAPHRAVDRLTRIRHLCTHPPTDVVYVNVTRQEFLYDPSSIMDRMEYIVEAHRSKERALCAKSRPFMMIEADVRRKRICTPVATAIEVKIKNQ